MYSSLQNVQILVAALKAHGVSHIVVSPGTRHVPLVMSVAQDPFFTCHSIVDERSAAFFALGLIQTLHQPVAVCCTSGTAAANYLSATCEAFYQQLPLVLLTADRNAQMLFQQEEQMIPQPGLFRDVCKAAVTLPPVRDDRDFWYCSRLVNEALLELEHREAGPVHINFVVENDYPLQQGIVRFEADKLPDVRRAGRLTLEDPAYCWDVWASALAESRVLVLYGQHPPLGTTEGAWVAQFARQYNCVVLTDHLSNLHGSRCIPAFSLLRTLSRRSLEELRPDIVVTVHGNNVMEARWRLAGLVERHWHVSREGRLSDPFHVIPDVVECAPTTFFRRFAALQPRPAPATYFEAWQAKYQRLCEDGGLLMQPVEYSAVYAVQQLLKGLPAESLLHLGNSNTVRLANCFPPNPAVRVYCNRGTNGIDGSLSTFLGQACGYRGLSFLVIGDLSFFYDMNALWQTPIGPNVRILLCNNAGGAIFHSYPVRRTLATIGPCIAAHHVGHAEAWARDCGFTYLAARDRTSLDAAMLQLVAPAASRPILLEVFTDKEHDTQQARALLQRFCEEGVTAG